MKIAEFIKIKVLESGTQTAVARKTGVSQGTITKILNGDSSPELATILKIVKAYDLPIYEIDEIGIVDMYKADLASREVAEPAEEYKKEEGVLVLKGLTPSQKLLVEAVLRVPTEKVGETFDLLVYQEQADRQGKE